MNAHSQRFVPQAEAHKIAYMHMHNNPTIYQTPPQMLSPQSSSAAASTPSLVARSLTSSPSTSAIHEVEVHPELGPDTSHEHAVAHFSSFDFDTEDSPEPWFTGKTLLPYPGDDVAYSHSIRPSSFVPNPHALPYVPTITRKRSRVDPVHCGEVNVSWRPHHEWIRPLRAGTVAYHNGMRQGYARDVVDAGPWDTSLISELAAKFIERAAEGQSQDNQSIAPFAWEVFEAFRHEHGNEMAEVFAQQLRQCLLSEFRAWWLQTLPSSIFNLPRCSPSPPHAPPHRHLSSALAVAEFAGDLFAHSLSAGHYLLLCVNMLLDRLSILEEVYALHLIVHHAGAAMYSRLQMIDFVDKLHRRAKEIAPGASALGHPNVVAEVGRLVEELTSLMNEWASARTTPSPSECSDLFSEYSDHNPDVVHLEPSASYPAVDERTRRLSGVPAVPPGLTRPSANTGDQQSEQVHGHGAGSFVDSSEDQTVRFTPAAHTQDNKSSWADLLKTA